MTATSRDFFQGDTRALARAISLVENRSPAGTALMRQLFEYTGQATVIGVTGSPGSGKSSLVDRLAAAYRTDRAQIGIVAVDPSSPFTGGAILGDRIRMQTLSTDPGIFIRSMATRGHLGGLAAATADVIRVLDAAARSPILVETVGVGQDEVDIVKLADVSIVVLVPGMGDDVQALKAGIMEIGDIFVINKCDRPGVEKMEHALTSILSLAHRADGWIPPIVKTIATEGAGTEELRSHIDAYLNRSGAAEQRLARKRDAARDHLTRLLQEQLVQAALEKAFPADALGDVLDKIARHETDPYAVVETLTASNRRIDHIGIAVRSIEEALKLYEGVLELRVSGYENVEEQGVRVAMIPVGDSRIELLEPLRPDSPVEKFMSKRGEGIHHISLSVDNIESALERLKAAGVRLIDSSPKRGAGNSKIAFVHPAGMHGVLLELVEHEE
ncbi:MAG TPA: methylmalonyl Co-A mutase-associated GTPase MeaB [Terriglobia bacterium]|nr:methylmalonyl Co-A mutase-associated GTPase MeaB [Terriglobia bacterium]